MSHQKQKVYKTIYYNHYIMESIKIDIDNDNREINIYKIISKNNQTMTNEPIAKITPYSDRLYQAQTMTEILKAVKQAITTKI